MGSVEIRSRKCHLSLRDANPTLASEWHPCLNEELRPEGVLRSDQRRVYWRCSTCGHDFQNSVRNRIYRQAKCPACVRRNRSRRMRLASFEESLGYLNPYLMREWHSSLNEDLNAFQLYPKTTTKIWWHCQDRKCGHVWQVEASQRVSKRTGCPMCAKRRQSVAYWHPHLVKEWDSQLNQGLRLDQINRWSNKVVKWTCTYCRQVWEAGIQQRIKQKDCCPHCEGYDEAKRAYRIYLLRSPKRLSTGAKRAYFRAL